MPMSFNISYRDDGYRFTSPADKSVLLAFCRKHSGNPGYMDFHIGSRNRRLGQNSFFHGPLIDAFVRLTGETDRLFWKSYLKDLFAGKYFIRHNQKGDEYKIGTSDLAEDEMRLFLNDCVNHLSDEGGHLEEIEGREYLESIAEEK